MTNAPLRGGINKWRWTFNQTSLPFLAEYVVNFVNSLVTDGIREVVDGLGKHRVYFRKRAIESLLKMGMAHYSWKASRWIANAKRLENKIASCCNTKDVATKLGVSLRIVRRWVKTGKLKCFRKSGESRRGCYYITRKKLENFQKTMLWEKKRVTSAKDQGTKLSELAEMLGTSSETLRNWHRRGRLRATLVYDWGHANPRYLVVPQDEVQRLLKQKSVG